MPSKFSTIKYLPEIYNNATIPLYIGSVRPHLEYCYEQHENQRMGSGKGGISYVNHKNNFCLNLVSFTLRASCSTVYCNQSYLFVCGWVCYHDNSIQWCSPRDQGNWSRLSRRLEDKKWKSWSWCWTFGFGHRLGLGLEEKVLQFFKTFVVILDGSEQGTPWHFVRDNKSSLPFGSHAHQHKLRGYLTIGAIC